MAKSTREAMAEAFAEASGEKEPEVEAEGDEEIEEPGDEGEAVEEPDEHEEAEASGDEEPEEHAAEEEGAEGERKRDPATGKFLKTPGQKVAALDKAKAAAAAAAAAQPALRPPADWKAAAREEFAKLPRIVQEEAIRLHLETKKTLEQSAAARQLHDAFTRTTQPYEHIFRAQGRSALDGVGYLLQTYAQLQTAPMQQRAQLIGGFIRDFLGTDDNSINLLAAALGGPAPAGGRGAAAVPPVLTQAQVDQMIQQGVQQHGAKAQQQSELKAISDFETSAPEFLNDVVNEIKAIVAIEKQQGKPITMELLKAAYDKALRLNPQTAAILKQRDDAAAAKKKLADSKKRKGAELGLKHEPAGPGSGSNGKARSTQEQLAQEWAKAERGNRV